MTRLYYEAHITVQGKDISLWDQFQDTATNNDFRVSRFDVDEVDHYDGAWFLSTRDTDFDVMKNKMRVMIDILTALEYDIRRWKIEDTILDSKHGDILE